MEKERNMSIPTSENPYSTGGFASVAPEERTLGLVAYILAIFTTWIGPLILWLVKKDQSKFVAYHAVQALMLMAFVFVIEFVANIILTVLHLTPFAMIVWGVLGLGSLALNVMAAIAANKGEWYEMPVVGPYAKKSVGM